jgi:hypothetical protein
MKMEDRVLKLVVKKMTGEATAKELQKLNDLGEKNVILHDTMEFLFTETKDERQADNRSQVLFEKIKAKIKSTE